MRQPVRFLVVLFLIGLLAPTTAVAEVSGGEPLVLEGPDFSTELVPRPPSLAAADTPSAFADDPLGLVPKLALVQRYSLDTDHFEVWLCGSTGYTLGQAVAALEAAATDYFAALSGGRYSVTFSPGGTTPESHCLGSITPVGDPEGIFVVDDVTGGGYATPGRICVDDSSCDWIGSTYPDNDRYAVVGFGVLDDFPSVAAHELGHTLHWPHSNSGLNEYDNPIDLMSGNNTLAGWTEADPYGSLAFNRYQSGWVDPIDVVIATPLFREVLLQPYDAGGIQMIVVPTPQPGVFYALGARTRSTFDPIPSEWEGVEVYKINHDCGEPVFGGVCPGIWRKQTQEPPNPDGVAHVMQPGETINLEGIAVSVTARSGTGFSVAIGDPANSLPFFDIASSTFVDDIVWVADRGITTGCNPPANTEYCPKGTVTREQVAAFLVRALGLTDDGGGNTFIDDDGSVFEDDIAKLAAAGITAGCNADGTAYCPKQAVTRQQMAAFLVRAYRLTDNGGGNTFTDDDGSRFEDDIAKLAAAGVTQGCNPPDNTEFCPFKAVTREQMAAFLYRASG